MASNDDLFAGLIVNDVLQPSLNGGVDTNLGQSQVKQSTTPQPQDNDDDLFEGLIIDGKPMQARQPEPPEDDRNFLQKFGDFVTGESGQTEAIKDLPEFDIPMFDTSKGFGENVQRQGKLFNTALGFLTSFDPKRQIKILQENFPKLKILVDEKGNAIVDGTAYGGNKGVLNLPGISTRDLLQAGFQVAAFTPAAKAASIASSTLGKAAVVGGASAATQTAQDLTAQATGAEEEVKLGNVNPVDVAIAGVAGGALEYALKGLSVVAPLLRKAVAREGITNDIRETFRNIAKENGVNPSEVTDDIIKSFLKSSGKSANPNASAALQGEKEFGIQLTKGQRSGNQKQLSFENSARAGNFGGKPQEILLAKEAQTNKEILAARSEVQKDIAGNNAVIESQQESGALIKQGTRQAEETADAAVRESFDSVGDATLDGQSFIKLVKSVRDSVKSPEFLKSKGLAPASNELLKNTNKYLKTVGSQAKEIKPQHIKQIELMRRTIGSKIDAAANPPDKRTLVTMKNRFDDFLDNAVRKALFSGDQEALSVLKESRSLFSRYAAKFRVNPIRTKSGRTIADKEGDFIEKIIAANPTDEQTINAIFGAGNNFGNLAGARMAKRFKNILGKESTEWASVRQAAFLRLMKYSPDQKTISGSKTVTAIREAIEKNNSLMKELYTGQELLLFRRLAAQIKRAKPDLAISRENPSGTAQVLIKSITTMISRLGQTMGFASGNPMLIVGSKGIEIGAGFRAASKARKAARPFAKASDVRPQPVAAGTSAAVYGGN